MLESQKWWKVNYRGPSWARGTCPRCHGRDHWVYLPARTPNCEKKISTGRDLGVTLRTFGRFVWRMAAGSALSDATDSATLTLPVDRQAIAEAATRFSTAHVRADGFLARHRAVAIRWVDAPGIRAQILAGAMHEMPTDAVSHHRRPCLRLSSIVPMNSANRAPCSCHARASPRQRASHRMRCSTASTCCS